MADQSVWDDIAAERLAFADVIEGLTHLQLDTPSLCGEWTVRDVAGHVLMPLITNPAKVALTIVASRGFHRGNAKLARDTGRRPQAELVELLRRRALSHFTPPLHPPAAPLTDLLIHGQDVRRPLGITREFAPHRLRRALDFLVSSRAHPGFVRRGRLLGVPLRATDLDWTHGLGGSNQEVAGPAEALMMVLTGRMVALPEVSGPGVQRLAR